MRQKVLKARSGLTWAGLAAGGEAVILDDRGEAVILKDDGDGVSATPFWTTDPGIAAQVMIAKPDDILEVGAIRDLDDDLILVPA